MKRFKSYILAACAVFVAVAYAAPAPTVSADSAALSIVPKKNYQIDPGETINDTLVSGILTPIIHSIFLSES